MIRSLRRALATLVLPILLAWTLTHYLHHRLYRADVLAETAVLNRYGPVRITLRLPGTHAGLAEPLVTCGQAGQATLAFIKHLPNGRSQVGIEFWGTGAYFGDEFAVARPDAILQIECFFPALYPPVGDPAWGAIPLEIQRIRRSHYYVVVDGVVRLTGVIHYEQPPLPRLYYAVNPIGGSLVSDRLTGTVLAASQHAP